MKEREAAPTERGARSVPARPPRVSANRTVPMPPGVRERLGDALRLGKSGDAAERQADAAAGDRAALASPAAPTIDDAPVATEVADELERPGAPLPAAARKHWERKLGADLGAVRVHHDGPARASADRIDASAYTHGDHVVLGDGAGPATVGHELAHVLQQRAAGGPPVVQRNERARREAQRMYDKNSIGATPEAGNPIVLFEDGMTKDLNDKLKSGDYALIHEAFDNVIVFYNDDDIAYAMTKALSDEELRELATRPSGRLVLKKLWDEMDAGPTDSEDEVQMQRIQNALAIEVTTPLTIIDDKGEVLPKGGKDDWADRPWMQPDRIKDKNQVRVREDGTPTNNQGQPLKPGEPGWDHMVDTAKWTLTVPLGPLSNLRLLSLARFAQWLFDNDPEKVLGPGSLPKLGRRLGEVRDEMVARIKKRASDQKQEAAGPVYKMPDSEPEPMDYSPQGPNPLEQLDRIRNMGGFGSLAMVITIFATDDINYAITVGEGVDTVANMAMLAAARRRAGQVSLQYMGSGGGSNKPSSYARGGVFGTQAFPVGPQGSKDGGVTGKPSIDHMLQQMKSGKPMTYNPGVPQWEVTPDGFIRPKVPVPRLEDFGKSGMPKVIRLTDGTVIPFDNQEQGGGGVWMTPTSPNPWATPGPIKFSFDIKGPPAPPKEMKPGVFVLLVSKPDGSVMETENLIHKEKGVYDKHPNKQAIEAAMGEAGIIIERKETLGKVDDASANAVMIDVYGPGGAKFTRSRIQYNPRTATSQHIHHELNHLLDYMTGKNARWERHIADAATFEKAKSMTVDQIIDLPAPKSSLNKAQGAARYNINEIRNHCRDIAEYGFTVPAGGKDEVPAKGTFAETKRDPLIQRYTREIRSMMTSNQLNEDQRKELGDHIRDYINGAFPELPAEYTKTHYGKGNIWTAIGVPETGEAKK